ncbi:MAG: C4-dicarboxylate ABC transporter, partial [Vibrionaceae bacterium]
ILKEVTETRNAESNKVEEQNKQYVIEAGGVVRELTPEQRQLWVDALKPVWKKFEKDIGSDLIEAALASNNK